MDNLSQLQTAGLNTSQAQAYLHLLDHGQALPAQLAKQLHLTRSNAYKVLDQLVELGLANRKEVKKKLLYFPDNPMSLSNLVAEQRNLASTREEAVQGVLQNLLAKYSSHSDDPSIKVASGHKAVINAYHQQIMLLEPIYFIRSRSDIPLMGFEAMDEIRTKPGRHNVERFGITPDMETGTSVSNENKRSKLTRTWVKQEDYTAPVEWSVSGSNLLIVVFGNKPHAITINNTLVAEAFTELWKLLNGFLCAKTYSDGLPRHPKNSQRE